VTTTTTTTTTTDEAVDSKKRTNRFRRRILEMSQVLPAIHIGGAFSCLEIVDAIYFGLMRRRGKEMLDTFILSKGHGSLAQYAVLEALGVLSSRDLDTFCVAEGRLGGHPDYGLPGIAASTGSLGHGLGIGMGMALADKVSGADRRVYVVMSDGELQEGSVWESLMLAPSLGLTSLIGFVDLNDFQTFSQTSKTHPNFYPVVDKLRAFGWETVEVDGHDTAAILSAFHARAGKAPFMVVAKTTKGKGVSYMENVAMWHYRSPNAAEYQQALAELAE
jgi:transketolase